MNVRIKELREAAGLTQNGMAEAIGKSTRAVQTWERGEKYPNAEAIWAMCELFGCDPNTLLGWYDEHPRASSPSLTPHEARTLSKYRQLTPSRQEAVEDMLDGLVAKSKEHANGSRRSDGARMAV